MKVLEFVRLLQLLPKNSAEAVTVKDLGHQFFQVNHLDELSASQYQKIYRWLEALSTADGHAGAVVDAVVRGKAKHYFLNDSQILGWVMTEQTALGVLLARQALNALSGETEVFSNTTLDQAAGHKVGQADRSTRLWNRLRMARHGIGRLPPRIEPGVMKALVEGVANDRQIRCRYINSQGVSKEADVTIHGLVFKDDTIYALAGHSLSGPLHHMAVHRIQSAMVLHKQAVHQPGFNLDQYIERDYQLSHVLNRDQVSQPVELVLRARPDYVYHFTERPLTVDMQMVPDTERSGWMRLTARLPDNHVLTAFIQSMGPGIEVLAPLDLRARIASEALETAGLYESGPNT